jgi:hypothetical protein
MHLFTAPHRILAYDANARLRHLWLRIKRVLRGMLHARWSAEA